MQWFILWMRFANRWKKVHAPAEQKGSSNMVAHLIPHGTLATWVKDGFFSIEVDLLKKRQSIVTYIVIEWREKYR